MKRITFHPHQVEYTRDAFHISHFTFHSFQQ